MLKLGVWNRFDSIEFQSENIEFTHKAGKNCTSVSLIAKRQNDKVKHVYHKLKNKNCHFKTLNSLSLFDLFQVNTI